MYQTVQQLLEDPVRCKEMSKKLRDMAVLDSAERICDIVLSLAKK